MAFLNAININTKHTSLLNLTEQGIFGIHGGGNIGLGCMADIVTRSPFDYRIIATSSDKFMNSLINVGQRFWLRHGPEKNHETSLIKNVTMVDTSNPQNIINLYCHADILAICLAEKAITDVAELIAQGLLLRYKTKNTELPILVLMNRIDGAQFVKKEISHALLHLTNDADIVKNILNKIEFIPTVVDRIVNKIDKKTILSQLKKQFNPVEIERIFSNPEELAKLINTHNLQFCLYRAEKEFSLFVPDTFQKALHFPNIQIVPNLTKFAEIKNKYINGPHSMLAWMGGLMGCKTISEAIDNPSMLCFIKKVMEQEIEPILKAEYPNIPASILALLKTSFIKRCKASSDDPIVRVGRDPLRKLYTGGRVRGLLELKRKHGLNIATPELERGMAAGILYAIKKIDPSNEECQTIREIYRNSGSYQAILCYSGPYGDGKYPGLDQKRDQTLIKNVLHRISAFEKIYKLTADRK